MSGLLFSTTLMPDITSLPLKPHNKLSRPNNLCLREVDPRIQRQMPQPIKAMKHKEKGHNDLGRGLEDEGPGGESGGQASGAGLEADCGPNKVQDAPQVEPAAEKEAGEAVCARREPGDLRL
jgi:hypothetical protein